jgi:hypothetical protein
MTLPRCTALFLSLVFALPVAARDLPPPDPRLDAAACVRIPTGPGPGLLALPDSPRLLISSHDRRAFETPGELHVYDTGSNHLQRLLRSGEPPDLVLRPRHMDIAKRNGETLLYVVNHDEPTPNGRRHSVLVYAVTPERLVFRQRLTDPLLSSPNHIAVAPDGDLYVSNDRRDGSSLMEFLLRQNKANLVHYREGAGWKVVAEGLSFPNGVRVDDERVLVVLTFGNAMLSWPRYEDGSLGTRQQLVALPALDGLSPGPEPGTWLTVSHGALLDYLRHRRNSGHPSAATVYLVNGSTRSYAPFFADDGRRISAVSTALIAHKALWLGQRFDSFMLRCPLKTH